MNAHRILFRTDCLPKTGFGHLSRCLNLARYIRTQIPKSIIFFCGCYSENAVEEIKKVVPTAFIITNPKDTYDLGVIDTMFDSHDIEYYNKEEISHISNKCLKSILICSSRIVPDDLNVDKVIAYVAEIKKSDHFELMNSLKYAPVSEDLRTYRNSQKIINTSIHSIFIGLGGWQNLVPLDTILGALNDSAFNGKVHILLTPFFKSKFEALKTRYSKCNMYFYCQVPEVGKILKKADISIVTYGNLMFECLAIGVPTLVVGIKRFQLEYTEIFAKKELLYDLGSVFDLSSEKLHNALEYLTLSRRKALSKQALKYIDVDGIQRIANIIIQTATHSN